MTTPLTSLNNLNVIKIIGDDAATFLQGQLTCDVQTLKRNDSTLAAICNHKGRVIASFHLLNADNAYYLLMPNSMRDVFLTHIEKYAAFSKVSLAKEDDWFIYGGDKLDEALSIKQDEQRFISLCKQPQNANNDLNAWQLANIRQGFCYIEPKTSALFTPQMLAYEKLGALSFDKGCYVGQEVIARTHYLGKLKRHLYPFNARTAYAVGDAFFNNKEAIGVVVACAVLSEHAFSYLVVAQDRLVKLNP